MALSRVAAGAVALAAISFGVGFLVGTPGEGFDADANRRRIERAVATHDRLEQAALLAPLLQAMGPEEALEIAAAFESTFASGGGGLPLELFVESWARFDLEGSRERIFRWPSDRRREAWPPLLRSWARVEPLKAVEILGAIPDAAVRRRAWPALIEGWSATGDVGLWGYLSQIPEQQQRSSLGRLALEERIWREGAARALQEIEAIPDEPTTRAFKSDLFVHAATLLLRNDLEGAVSLAEAKRDSIYGAAIQRRVALKWASRDGSAAMAWLRGQPARAQRGAVIAQAYRNWLSADEPAARAWLAEAIADPDVAPAVLAHAGVLARKDPEGAIAWAEALPQPELREPSLAEIERVRRRGQPHTARPVRRSSEPSGSQ